MPAVNVQVSRRREITRLIPRRCVVSSVIARREGKAHNARVIMARTAEGVPVPAAARAVIVVAGFPEVVEEVSGVGVAGAEEFMGNSESVVARACDAAELMKEN